MKAAGYTLVSVELRAELVRRPDTHPITVLVDGDEMPVQECSDGLLVTADDLFAHSYTEAHNLLQQIAEDPKVWTKKKIMEALADMGYGS